MPNFSTNIMDFGGFDSSIILILRGEIMMSIGDSPESLSQAMLVGVMLVGGLGIASSPAHRLRPISLLRVSLLRFVDSKLPGNFLWT